MVNVGPFQFYLTEARKQQELVCTGYGWVSEKIQQGHTFLDLLPYVTPKETQLKFEQAKALH